LNNNPSNQNPITTSGNMQGYLTMHFSREVGAIESISNFDSKPKVNV